MASAPSASALSAVLRCRGNLWKRNPQSARPGAAVYSSGLARGRSQAPARVDLLLLFRGGTRASPGRRRRRLTAALASHQRRVDTSEGENSRELGNLLRHSRVAQSPPGSARPPAVRHALVAQLARGFLSLVPCCTDVLPGVVRTVTYRGRALDTALAQELGGLPAGALKVSVISPRSVGDGGHAQQCLATSSWTTVKNACLSLTALVSGVMCSRLAVLFRPGSSETAVQPDHQQSRESDQQVGLKKQKRKNKSNSNHFNRTLCFIICLMCRSSWTDTRASPERTPPPLRTTTRASETGRPGDGPDSESKAWTRGQTQSNQNC